MGGPSALRCGQSACETLALYLRPTGVWSGNLFARRNAVRRSVNRFAPAHFSHGVAAQRPATMCCPIESEACLFASIPPADVLAVVPRAQFNV